MTESVIRLRILLVCKALILKKGILIALSVSLISGIPVAAQEDNHFLSIISGDFPGYISSTLLLELMEGFEEVVPYLIYQSVPVDPHWPTYYFEPSEPISVGSMRGFREYGKNLWLLGHLEGCEVLRGSITFPDLYDYRGGVIPHTVQREDDDWFLFKLRIMGIGFDPLTLEFVESGVTLKHELVIARIQDLASHAENEEIFEHWLLKHQEHIKLLVGRLGFIRLRSGLESLDYGYTDRPLLEFRWLWLLLTELVEFAESPREYMNWLSRAKEDIVSLLNESAYERLRDYANDLERMDYPCVGNWGISSDGEIYRSRFDGGSIKTLLKFYSGR